MENKENCASKIYMHREGQQEREREREKEKQRYELERTRGQARRQKGDKDGSRCGVLKTCNCSHYTERSLPHIYIYIYIYI